MDVLTSLIREFLHGDVPGSVRQERIGRMSQQWRRSSRDQALQNKSKFHWRDCRVVIECFILDNESKCIIKSLDKYLQRFHCCPDTVNMPCSKQTPTAHRHLTHLFHIFELHLRTSNGQSLSSARSNERELSAMDRQQIIQLASISFPARLKLSKLCRVPSLSAER